MIRMKTHNRHSATLAGIFAVLALLLATLAPAQSISLTASTGYQTAIALSYSSPVITGNNLSVTVQITNTSGTWVYLQQDQTYSTNSPVVLPYTVYLLGPGASKTITNVNFVKNTYLQFNVTTPIGLDFTTLATDPKPRALFGALIVDCMTRGLLTFPLPANAFDEPFNGATGVVDPVLDSIVSTLQQDGSSLGSAAVDLKNRDWVKLSVDFGQIGSQIASESSTLQNSISQILQRSNVGLSSGQVGTFFNNASTWLGVIAEVLDLPAKYTLLHDLSISTFGAPTTSWNRFDAVFNTPAPFISSVSPSSFTGLPLPQTQLIRIYGSGFTTNSTLIFNSTTPSDPTRLTFVNSSEIDYLIRTDTNAATWFVMVIDGSQTSNLIFFSVTAPPTSPTGSLVVNLSPTAAVTAGAQWQVDGTGFNNSGQTAAALVPGSHSVTFKAVSGYTTPASFSVNVVANAQTTTNATYSAVAATTYTLTLNAANGSVTPSPSGWNGSAYVYNSGSVVQLTASANTGYHFTNWNGDASGTVNPTTITMNGNKTVSASFASGDPNMATVTVTIKPDAAANAGVTWSVTGDSQRRASGTSLSEVVGSGYTTLLPITLNLVPGWLATNGTTSFYVPVSAGIVTNVLVTCVTDTTPGLLTVTLSPPDVVTAGAKWHVNGTTNGNGATVSLPAGTYPVTFDAVSGWTAPASQSVTIQRSQTTVLAGNYTPPAGQPAIYGISPPIGPMSGGTVMTISGANFTSPASVAVGGQNATNVTVLSASQITCTTPSSSIYGTTNVIVQTSGGSATNLNGFAYGMTNGNKLSLVTAVSGTCYSLDVSGGYAFIGEGRSLVVVNVSSPSSPSRVNSILLPGTIYDIKIWGNYAYVANGEAGLQVVDISTPSSPKICGYNVISNNVGANSITISGGRAYVADENYGLEIFDLSVPTVPSLISVTAIPNGTAYSVITKTSVNGVFAYISTGNGVQIVDVSNPYSTILRGYISTGGSQTYSCAISGNYIYAPTWYQANNLNYELLIIDITNPDSPTTVGTLTDSVNSAPKYFYIGTLTTANNVLYAISSFDGSGFSTLNISGNSLLQAGSLPHVTGNNGKIVINGGYAYIATQDNLKIISVGNTYSPSLASAFNDGGQMGYYLGVGVSGNSLCATYPSGYQTFDISTPLNTRIAGQATAPFPGYYYAVGNGRAYAISNACICVIDFTTPSFPHQVGSVPPSTVQFIQGMALSGSTLYAAGTTPDNRFVAFDVSNPSSPQLIGAKTFTDGLGVGPVAVSGNRAVVGGTSLRVLDISNISSPTQTGILTNMPVSPNSRVVISPDGNYVYSTGIGANQSFTVISITNPSNPQVVTNITVDSSSAYNQWGMAVRGNELIMSKWAGVFVYDISVPASPVMIRSYLMRGCQNVCAPSDSVNQNNMLYVADSDGGIVALLEQDIQPPDVYITTPVFAPVYTNIGGATTIALGGITDDNVGVTAMAWSSDRGGSGIISQPDSDGNWYVNGVKIYPGSNNLTVNAFDAAGNIGSDVLTVIYPAANQNQTITFPPIAGHTFGDAPITLAAAASSGLPVTFSVVSGPATLTSSNVLTLNGAGSVTVQASQPGNSSYNAAPSTNVSFNVTLANQAITFAPIPTKAPTDAPFALTATTSSGLPVYFSVLSGPAGINSSNYVTLLGAGTVSILAWQPGNSNYNAAATVQQSFTVSQIPQTIAFGALSQQRSVDAPFPIFASASSGLPVNFSVLSGPAQLSGNVLTLTGAGTVTVRASQAGSSVFAPAANVDQSLTVLPPSNTVGSPQYNVSGFNLTFYGTVGSNYLFQASSNLVNWSTLQTFSCTNTIMNFRDTSATGMARRFYQIKPQ